jgi:hypothetical protein
MTFDTPEDLAAASKLTASELAACAVEGCRPADMLRIKKATSLEAQQARLARADNAARNIRR